MSKVYKNLFANFLGSIITALVSLLSIPLYLHFLGVGAFALVAVFGTLLSMLAVLDMGLIQTLSRELARLVVLPNVSREMRNLVRTLEIVYILIGVLVGCFVIFIAPWMTESWLKNQTLPDESVVAAVRMMGAIIAVQWPIGLYIGGLMGLQEQTLLNILNVGMTFLRVALSVLLLWLWEPKIETFFFAQLLVSSIHVLIVRCILWKKLPESIHAPNFSFYLLCNVKNFATGVAVSGLIGSLLLQLDKIILTKILSLEMFGYYAIANMISMNLYRLFGPVYSSIYPRLVNLVASDSQNGLAIFYHKSAQLIAVFVFPASAILILFSYDLVSIWLQDSSVATKVAPIASILLIGTMLNGIMHVPYGLQLAAGWTSLGIIFGCISVVVFAALLVLLTQAFGVLGAAFAWPIQQAIYFFFSIPIMHKRLLKKEMWSWYLFDVSVPVVICFFSIFLMWKFMPELTGKISILTYIGIAFLVSYACLFLFHSAIRREALHFFRMWMCR